MSELEPMKHGGGSDSGLVGYIGTVWKKENAVVVYSRKTNWHDYFTMGLYPLPQLRMIGVYKGDVSNFKKDDKVFVKLKPNASLAVNICLNFGVALSTFSNIEYIDRINAVET